MGEEWPEYHYDPGLDKKSGYQDSDVQLISASIQYKEHGFAFATRARTYFDFRVVFFGGDSKLPDFQVSRFQDFPTPTAAIAATIDNLSDPNLTPLPIPTHPGIKYVARSPCCNK